MQGLRKVLERRSRAAAAALGLLGVQCSGQAFNAGSGGAPGGTDSGGSAAQGGTGGSSSSGDGGTAGNTTEGGASAGQAGDGGASGKGGGGSDGCDCSPGEYCLEGSPDCWKCNDLSRVFFEEPVRLATVSDGGAGSRFPRVGSSTTDLIYRLDGAGLRYTTDASTSAGSAVPGTIPGDSALQLLPAPIPALAVDGSVSPDVFFDRAVMGVPTLYLGSWKDGLGSAKLAPPPFNSGAGDFSIVLAPNAAPARGRAFWMTARDSPVAGARRPRLVTAPLEVGASVADVELTLSVGQQPDCAPLDVSQLPMGSPPIDADLGPWVSSDGSLLVFSTTRLGPGCTASNQKKDIYTVLLQPSSGQPLAAALPLKDVNGPEDDVDPSFSADLCDLYFASNRDGSFAVYRARRR
jgi:hypothetical protein